MAYEKGCLVSFWRAYIILKKVANSDFKGFCGFFLFFNRARSPPFLICKKTNRKGEKIMNKRPKRRTHRDNPYTLIIVNDNYFVEFKDSLEKKQIVSISKEIFEAMDRFELDDLKELNEFDNHIEHSEIYEENLNKRVINKPEVLEIQAEKNILYEMLYSEISKLPDIQRKRFILYYFYDMTLKEIADMESCSISPVKRSIDRALEKISKKIKK